MRGKHMLEVTINNPVEMVYDIIKRFNDFQYCMDSGMTNEIIDSCKIVGKEFLKILNELSKLGYYDNGDFANGTIG